MVNSVLVAALGGAAMFAISEPAGAEAVLGAGGTTSHVALSDGELDGLRGGDGDTTIVTSQTLSAITNGNVINGGFTAGDVAISDSALSNFNGFGNIIINTGAQVTLQTGMNVTVNTSR